MSEMILQDLREMISELINCGEDEVTPEARLVDDLGFESIDFLELAMTLSHRYRIEVDEEALFLSNFRPILRNNGNGTLLDALARAYPHLDGETLQGMLAEAPRGNVLNVSHLARYVAYHTR